MARCPACDESACAPSHLGQAQFEGFEFEYRRCVGCSTLFVDPIPDDRVFARIYSPSYLEAHYGLELEGENKSPELAEEQTRVVGEMVQLVPGGRLLDIGAGSGLFLKEAARAGFVATGHEREAATAARTSAAANLRVVSGPLEQLTERFDVIHMADILEHHPRPIELLDAAKRLLAPGGRLFLRGPLENQRSFFQLMLRVSRAVRRPSGRTEAVPVHLVLFTLQGWQALLRRAGVTVDRNEIIETHWPAPEKPNRSLVSLTKEVSMRFSRTLAGRALKLGSRVVTVGH